MTHPTQTLAAVVAIVAIVGLIGALRLTPDADTDKLFDTGSDAYAGTEDLRDRFGDDAIVVLVEEDLQQLVLTEDIRQLLKLETCLAGNAPPNDADFPQVCRTIAALGATRVVFGPATFLNQTGSQAGAFVGDAFRTLLQDAGRAAGRATRRAQQQGLSEERQGAAADAAQREVYEDALAELTEIAGGLGAGGLPGLDNPGAVVFDSRLPEGTPKSRFGYLFPSSEGALVTIRLEPDLSDETRREATELIRQATADPAFELGGGGSYRISGVPIVVEGLADELGKELFLLLGVALAVMAMTLFVAFGPPLRLLPLFVALGASAIAFGLLSIVGGSLTMASVAVLPVVIGLGVDYAIQLQARFREATAAGQRPAAAAVIAAIRGGPVIGTAALATAVGFLALVLSPIPMVREFGLALVIGIIAALVIAVTAGLAAISLVDGGADRRRRFPPLPLEAAAAGRLGTAAERLRQLVAGGRRRALRFGNSSLATAISRPGLVLLVAAALAAIGWAASTRTEVVSEIDELVPADLPALQSVAALESATGVSGELDVIVRGEDVTTPEAVTWMREFKQRVLEQHGFAGEFPDCRAEGTNLCPGPALPDLIRADEPSQERIDGVLGIVPDYFLQAILSAPDDGDQIANLAFLIPVMPLDEQEALIDEIRAELDPPAGLSAEVVGLPVLAADANAELSGSRYWLTLVGLLAVGAVLIAVYRSPRRALVPLIPIALATGWSALVLAVMGIALNPMSATLGVLVIAVTTEFSVILAARYEEERAAGLSVGQALRLTYSRTGAAVLISGITSIAGFGVLIASGITMLRDFGLVTVVDLSVALAGVMVVLPATLVWADGGFRPLPAWRRRLQQRPPDVPEPSERTA